MTVSTLLPDASTEVAVGRSVCGRRADPSLQCTRAGPTGVFTQIAGDDQQFCGVTGAGRIACWDDSWPAHDAPLPKLPTAGVHGTVVDERGKPIANAEVLVCDDNGAPCGSVAQLAQTKPGTLASLVTGDPKGWSIATTAPDGTWSAPTHVYRLSAVITAPGREVIERTVQSPGELEPPIALRPASTIDIAAWCDGHACNAPNIVLGVIARETASISSASRRAVTTSRFGTSATRCTRKPAISISRCRSR